MQDEQDSSPATGVPFDLPDGIADDLREFATLPGAAREAFWQVLEPHLVRHLDDRAEAAAVRFAREYGIEQPALAPSVRALRYLCMQGAAVAVQPPRFTAALAGLGLPEHAATEIARLYAQAYAYARPRVIARTLGEHGDVVVGIDWRVDDIRASSHGRTDDLTVVMLTFRAQRGDTARRYTLQFMPEQIAELKAILDRFQ
jgi:hypothetical protein